ncbi:DEAD/DEAH box helicase [Treponema endosymbiont of Eucomonympha sp.]|uniref:DEAD/DEAH box helicase n=2 Tax=Treponema endosymbiont of Eucomonympha sp. TaxID=1580831 RepID=UPI0007852379|nr:DEAD/DEAH box helicase [Treponema endosymbiont of Eucomonympha sp.]
METISFEDLGLDEVSLAAVAAKGFETPSPIQALAIPRLLAGEANLVAKARTGTGKTAAFALPLVQTIREAAEEPRALVLTPTRELALQVGKEIESLASGKYPRVAEVYGGQSMLEQLRALKRGTEIVVGTPGRIMDHLNRGSLHLEHIDYFILDEADEMLDMGFIEDIEAIFAKANPKSRILLFSATMPPPILKIAAKFMGDYEIVEEEIAAEEPFLTGQTYWTVREEEKIEALVRLIDISSDFYGLVFTQTKVDADAVSRMLDERGYETAALHGDIAQKQREKILDRFRKKKTRILVATDVAARGIDIECLSHVVNYAFPFDGLTYVHRIGRTGRAGAKGEAVTFVRPNEMRKLEVLKQAIKRSAKGVINAGTIPSIKEVLAAKQKRLVERILASFISVAEADNDAAVGEKKTLQNVFPSRNPLFKEIAVELCSTHQSEEIVAQVLETAFGAELNPARYGEISNFNPSVTRARGMRFSGIRQSYGVRNYQPSGSDFANADSQRQMRLYVGLGRRDGFGARELANYFSSILNIPPRFVDRIEITENFSLASFPYEAGITALERAKRDRTMPHVHIDSRNISEREPYGRRKFMRSAVAV